MRLPFLRCLSIVFVPVWTAVQASEGYSGYRIDQHGDPQSAVYETENTPNATLLGPPDVYLDAHVSVDLISIVVEDITAKVNLDAKVLGLLKFSAGVDVSIDRVKLTIDDVRAKVLLEVRLGNVAAMVDDVLSSVDLNPILATVGKGVGNIVGNSTNAISKAKLFSDREL
ncbi:hypothetical protein PG999_001456 [Apiospora kogelbergensis]|uniref:Uncharacterized protein n=1 Tax=Apiospora kogelbergensis TaxID=1337665 RepID=A0AAW0REQ5_9PEZI